jgi:hypothetical protein
MTEIDSQNQTKHLQQASLQATFRCIGCFENQAVVKRPISSSESADVQKATDMGPFFGFLFCTTNVEALAISGYHRKNLDREKNMYHN